MKQTYKEYQEEIKSEQSGMSYDEIKHAMSKRNESVVELDNLPKQDHLWTDRGLKYTCENAGHPYHEAWKRRKARA